MSENPLDRFGAATERLRREASNENDEIALEAHRDCLRHVYRDAPWWDRWLGLSERRLYRLTNRYRDVASGHWRHHYDAMAADAELFKVYPPAPTRKGEGG